MRLGRDEHQRQERPGLPDQHARPAGHRGAQAAAGPAGHPRPDRGHDAVLQAVRLDQALPGQRQHPARERAPAVPRRARRAERPVRVHPVRQLLDQLPQLLVEPRQVRRPGRPAAGLPLHRRQPRPGHRRPARQPGRPVPAVPLPHHHELRGRLPQGPEPHQGDRQDQGTDGAAHRLSARLTARRKPPMHTASEADQPIGERELSRLRWRCRRGLLENDLFIERFFQRHDSAPDGAPCRRAAGADGSGR